MSCAVGRAVAGGGAAGTASATRLKRHCHKVILALGAAAPPEAFLFRGNAYLELGQPYFAMADYHTAAQVLQLSGAHEQRCRDALERFPDVQVGCYPSTDAHLALMVSPFLRHAEVRHINERVGRGVVALDHVAAGTLVMQAVDAWVRYPLRDGLCAFCTKPLPERFFSCSNPRCHEEYCSRDCRTMALGLYHARTCTVEGFQAVELDLYSQMKAAEATLGDVALRNAAAAQLLTLRIIGVALQMQSIPSALAQVRTLSGRIPFSPKVLATSYLDVYQRLAASCRITTTISYEELVGTLARVTANCFQDDNAIELNIPRAMFNHSCDSNVVMDAASRTMVASRDVRRGEELTINYYPHLKDLPFEQRAAELDCRGLDCQCSRCQAKR